MARITFKTTDVFNRLTKRWKDSRYIICYGGSSSSKSVSILQQLTLYALVNSNKRITISAESLPVLKKTVIPDWKAHVMQGLYEPKAMNVSEMVYRFPTGSYFQFIPGDDAARWHGLRSNIVYFDEVFYIKKAIYDQADIRTSEKVISSFNPAAEFWIKDLFDEPKTYVDHSTYKDNPYITQQIVDALEARIKTDPNFHRVYALGQWGSLEGLVFEEGTHWTVTDEWPDDFKKERYGLDFGYSIDPACLVHIRYHNGELYLKELVYKREMLNSDIAIYLGGTVPTVADSAEPKSIAELQRLGKYVKASVKGKDSINNGIQVMKQFKMNVHRDSVNVIKELRRYSWQENRQGEKLTKPIDEWNHAIDAARYAVTDMFSEKPFFVI